MTLCYQQLVSASWQGARFALRLHMIKQKGAVTKAGSIVNTGNQSFYHHQHENGPKQSIKGPLTQQIILVIATAK
jgi:hypothetical protein